MGIVREYEGQLKAKKIHTTVPNENYDWTVDFESIVDSPAVSSTLPVKPCLLLMVLHMQLVCL